MQKVLAEYMPLRNRIEFLYTGEVVGDRKGGRDKEPAGGSRCGPSGSSGSEVQAQAWLIVIFSTFVVGGLVLMWVLIREFHGRAMKRPEYAERFGALRNHLRFRGEASGPG